MKLSIAFLAVAVGLCKLFFLWFLTAKIGDYLKITGAAAIVERQPEIQLIENGFEGTCTTSRYWDCCKPTCGWIGNDDTTIGKRKTFF